jgi:hypothetical protein
MMPNSIKPITDFMSCHATPDDDRLRLSSGEVGALQEQLYYAQVLMHQTGIALLSIAKAFQLMKRHGTPPAEQLDVTREQAEAHAEKAFYAFSLVNEINTAIDARDEHDFETLMAALEGKE